jgi:transcriptional regulator GlxA family with amidase domain
MAAGTIWQTLVHAEAEQTLFRVRIVSPSGETFTCGNRIPVTPDCSVEEDPEARIVILPELWLGPDEDIHGRYPELMEWIRRKYRAGSTLYSACSGAIMLAETGLLDGCEATSHWGYQDLFSKRYPKVHFRPEPNLVFAETEGRIVSAGTWWIVAMSGGCGRTTDACTAPGRSTGSCGVKASGSPVALSSG